MLHTFLLYPALPQATIYIFRNLKKQIDHYLSKLFLQTYQSTARSPHNIDSLVTEVQITIIYAVKTSAPITLIYNSQNALPNYF